MDFLPPEVLDRLSPPDEGAHLSAEVLCDPLWWRDAAAAYSAWLDTPHIAPGAACCFQHYTGRVLPIVLRVWALTGRLMSLRHDRWQVRVDHNAATVGVRHSERILLGRADAEQVGQAAVEHLAPLLDGVLAASNLTRAAALGGPASSLASAAARIHAEAGAELRFAEVIAVVEHAAGRALIALEVDDRDPTLLLQHRRTCCLIRLGRDSTPCDTCPQLARSERVRRQRERHRSAGR